MKGTHMAPGDISPTSFRPGGTVDAEKAKARRIAELERELAGRNRRIGELERLHRELGAQLSQQTEALEAARLEAHNERARRFAERRARA